MGEVHLRLVEQHVANATAQHDTERCPGEEIVDVNGGGDRG